MVRPARLVVGVLGLHLVAAVLLWPSLPDRIPVHLDYQGLPTTWARTSMLSWFGPWLASVAVTLFIVGVERLGRANPTLWNVPGRDRIVGLPEHLRRRVERSLQWMAARIAVLCTLSFVGVHLGVYRAATGSTPGAAFAMLTVLPLIALLVVAVRDSRRVGAEILALSERASGPEHRPDR